ncbi:MAG: Fic family protein [Pseudomonadota bacterium]
MLAYLQDGHHLESWLGHRNRARQYDFMNTAFILWQDQGRPSVSMPFISELNFYAAHHLSLAPGIYRNQISYNVKVGKHIPPEHDDVPRHMADFMAKLSELYRTSLPITLAAYALWRLNWIHPFPQGNGRTSRALCYFLLCQRYDKWFPGKPLVELIRDNRQEYCDLLTEADGTLTSEGMADLQKIEAFLVRLMQVQIASVQP